MSLSVSSFEQKTIGIESWNRLNSTLQRCIRLSLRTDVVRSSHEHTSQGNDVDAELLMTIAIDQRTNPGLEVDMSLETAMFDQQLHELINVNRNCISICHW